MSSKEVKLASEVYALTVENKRLRDELAKYKPSWDDAPEWATHLKKRVYFSNTDDNNDLYEVTYHTVYVTKERP